MSHDPFLIDIERSMTVIHLKEAIKKKKEHTFGDVEADTLRLWKVGGILPVRVDDIRFSGSYLHQFLLRKSARSLETINLKAQRGFRGPWN